MKTQWTVSISVEAECSLDLEELWPHGEGRPMNPTVDDVKRELFGQSPSTYKVTRVLQDMDLLTFGIEQVKICIFQPVEYCDECKRPLGVKGGGHRQGCSLEVKAP